MDRVWIDNCEEPLRGGVFVVGVAAEIDPRFTADLIRVDVQAGGYSCLHFSVTGLIFRLADVREPRRDVVPLLRGFVSIGESCPSFELPPPPIDQRVDLFSPTWGEEIDVGELNRILSDYVEVPPLELGYEAFARGPIDRPDAWFRNWPGWSPNPSLLTGFNDQTLDQLISATEAARHPLEVFLLWENSD
ncbi:MAG: hypothetical protein QM817_10520 [Archangium sp.]